MECIITEGVKYAGSKKKLLPHILDITKSLGVKTVWDGFSGSTRVSQALVQSGYRVVSSDLSVLSEVFGKCYLMNPYGKDHYDGLIKELNNVQGYCGWFTETYMSLAKKPWQRKNLMRLDGIRDDIENLSGMEKCVGLVSLILALDKVDNTMGHQVSYLKEWSKRSYNDLVLEVPHIQAYIGNEVYRGDVFDLNIEADLAYFDPPYGANSKMPSSRVRYGSYYHLWETIIKNDKPEVFGAAARREDSRDTNRYNIFEDFREGVALGAIERLIKECKSKYVLFSYSNNGSVNLNDLLNVMRGVGEILLIKEVDYKKNVMATMHWTNEWVNNTDNKEYLVLLLK